MVILLCETQLAVVRSLVEEDCLIITAKAALGIFDPKTVRHCSLCLVDGWIVSDTTGFLQTCGVTQILTMKGIHWLGD
jgi:hypothetical protein